MPFDTQDTLSPPHQRASYKLRILQPTSCQAGMGPRTLLAILAHPSPYLRMLVLKAVTAHINFLQALFIFYLLPSRQLSSQTLLIPGFDSLKQNVAKQQSFYNPHGWGRDAQRVLSATPHCKHTHVSLPRPQARPEGMPLDAIRCPASPHARD